MGVKAGYRQTEVGFIPEHWTICPLGDLQPFVTSGSRGWAAFYAQHGALFVRITNLSRESIYLDLESSKYVELPSTDSEGARTQLKEGDVLISITADIGIVGYIDAAVPLPAFINQHIALVRIDESKASRKFVSYYLASSGPQKNFRTSTDTGAKSGMSLSGVQKILTALPPLPEQRAIAEALSDVDALLGGLDRLIAKKRDLKQAAMQQLLTGQTRLPGFHGEWEVKRLGQLGEFIKGSGIRKDEAASGDLPAVRYGELYTIHHNVVREYRSRVSKEVASTALRLKEGDLLFAGSGETKTEIGKCAAFIDPIEAYAGGDIVILRTNGVFPVFLGYLCNQPAVQRSKASKGQGDAVVHISAAALGSIEVTMPTLAEQTAIAQVLGDMDAELAVLEARREKTRQLKQGMMQELLTGRTRLV